jgi:hypothetical protein
MWSLPRAGLCRVPEEKHSAKRRALGKEPDSGSDKKSMYVSDCINKYVKINFPNDILQNSL